MLTRPRGIQSGVREEPIGWTWTIHSELYINENTVLLFSYTNCTSCAYSRRPWGSAGCWTGRHLQDQNMTAWRNNWSRTRPRPRAWRTPSPGEGLKCQVHFLLVSLSLNPVSYWSRLEEELLQLEAGDIALPTTHTAVSTHTHTHINKRSPLSPDSLRC